MFECKSCKLVQILNKVDLKRMYGKNYAYETSISDFMILHLKSKIKKFKKKKYIKKKSKILDIGCNDGTFLNLMDKSNFLYGIDPSASKFSKNYKNINIITDFFSKKKIIKKFGRGIKFDLITSFAVFYDVNNPNSFCRDIGEMLEKNGLWVCEISYLPLMLKNLTYDQICHEHMTYYTFTVFKSIIERNDLKIIDVSLNEINGGSIEVICAKKQSGHKENLKRINQIINDEKKINLQSYKKFKKRVENTKKQINSFLNKNSSVIGYGASTKGNIVLNHCNLDRKKLPFICDANPKKIGKFTPGSNIQIISKEKMRTLKPKFLFVLIWSFRSEIIKEELDYIKNGGTLVFHLPKFHLINQLNYRKYLNKRFKHLSYKY